MKDQAVHRLLLDCGFRDVLWPSPLGQKWGVVGELDGGVRIVVTCMPFGAGFRLHVTPAAAREWLGELLAHYGVDDVRLTDEPVESAASRATPWVAVSVGVGAIALFGWVISSIVR